MAITGDVKVAILKKGPGAFERFVKAFWKEVPGSGNLKWNWHMSILCNEMQSIAERVFENKPKENDVIVNISPGTSKSTLSSILFPAWIWTNMPHARILSASHASDLVLDLSNKARYVIKSELYRKYFPYVEIRDDTKGYYTNTKGGDRYTCTVSGKSPMGFHAHFILCLPYESRITTDIGQIPIGRIVEEKLPVKVLAFDHTTNKMEWQRIAKYEKNPIRSISKVTFTDGTCLEATGDHLVYVRNLGYIPIDKLKEGDRLLTDRMEEKFVDSVEQEIRMPEATYNINIPKFHNYFAESVLVHNCDDPIDPRRAVSEVELGNAKEFFDAVIPSRKVDKEVSVTLLIMQRLHRSDPTGHLLEKAKRDGASKIKHICLPAEVLRKEDGTYELGNVSPPKLLEEYIKWNKDANMDPEGLMDPERLTRKVLGERKSDGMYSFAGQYLQSPVLPGGQMFKEQWFNQRARSAPYVASRVRFWDRAATADGGCYTAGVLTAKDKDYKFYVEDCVHGQWDPDQRDEIILATAIRDRNRYGTQYEPVIYIEHEPGSSGVDAYRHTARKLAGFKVRPYRPTGDKVHRAEGWASQLAAGNVYIVDNGEREGLGVSTWDIAGFIDEHVGFPRMTMKDRVDAASSSFARLAEVRPTGTIHMLPLRKRLGKEHILQVLVLSRDQYNVSPLEDKHVLISIVDPLPPDTEEPNTVIPDIITGGDAGMNRCLKQITLTFADIDPAEIQDIWNESYPPYNQLPEKLVITKSMGKQIWAWLLKKGDEAPAIIAVIDDGGQDRRALSVAMGLAEVITVPRAVVGLANEPDVKPESKPKNDFVYKTVKNSRVAVY